MHKPLSKLILLGSSTGGPGHIEKIISSLPADFNATILIAQHMGDEYLPSFTSRLNQESRLQVSLAQDSEEIENSHIYVCTKYSEIDMRSGICFKVSHNPESTYNPSINALFNSATQISQKYKLLAIIMTGIGDDGVEGLKNLTLHGADAIAESKESAIVYGMPMRAAEEIKNIKILSIDDIVKYIYNFGVS